MKQEEFDKHVRNLNLRIPKSVVFNKDNVIFKDYKPFGISRDYNKIPLFIHPVTIYGIVDKLAYRVIARYPNIAISESGKILQLDDTAINARYSKSYKYVIVNVIPTRDGYVNMTTLHKLVALAWCDNDDYIINNIVDHKDDDKTNNHRSNLRWVSNSKNVAKSANKSDFRWLVKNIRTGVISRFTSFTGVGEFLDMNKTMFSADRCPFIVRRPTGAYIIEDAINFKGWLLEDKYDAYGNKYKYKVDGVRYAKLTEIGKAYNIRPAELGPIAKGLESMGKTLTILDKTTCKGIMAKSVITDEVLRFDTVKEAAVHFDVTKSPIAFRLNGHRVGSLLHAEWLFKNCDDDEYPIVKDEHRQMSKKVKVSKDGVVKVFNSMRSAANYLGYDKNTVQKFMLSNSEINGYIVTLVSDD